MSSHHFVREDQEPALIIRNIENFPMEILNSLLEWSPTVICSESVIEKVLSLGIKVDWLVTGQASLPSKIQDTVKLIPTQGKSELQAALDHLRNADYESVNIISDSAELGGLEEMISGYGSLIKNLFTQDQKYACIQQENFKKWLPQGVKFSISPPPIEVIGTIEKFSDEEFETTADGLVEVQMNKAPFFFSEPIQ